MDYNNRMTNDDEQESTELQEQEATSANNNYQESQQQQQQQSPTTTSNKPTLNYNNNNNNNNNNNDNYQCAIKKQQTVVYSTQNQSQNQNQNQNQQLPISADYLAQLIKDKKQLNALPSVFIHVQRLIDEEINKVRQALFQLNDVVCLNEPLVLPEPEGNSVQLQEKLYVPVGEHPEYNFVGRLLGPRGLTAKQLEQETGCKIMIRGKGSMRDKKKEEQNRGKANWEHLNDKLHVLITVEDTQNRAEIKIKRALEEVKQLLVPIVDGEDELKKRQLMELAIINGTYKNHHPQQHVHQQAHPQSPVDSTVTTAAALMGAAVVAASGPSVASPNAVDPANAAALIYARQYHDFQQFALAAAAGAGGGQPTLVQHPMHPADYIAHPHHHLQASHPHLHPHHASSAAVAAAAAVAQAVAQQQHQHQQHQIHQQYHHHHQQQQQQIPQHAVRPDHHHLAAAAAAATALAYQQQIHEQQQQQHQHHQQYTTAHVAKSQDNENGNDMNHDCDESLQQQQQQQQQQHQHQASGVGHDLAPDMKQPISGSEQNSQQLMSSQNPNATEMY